MHTPPLTLGEDPRQFVFFLVDFLGYTPGAHDAWEAGHFLFSFLGWFGCGKIPPSSLGWKWFGMHGRDGLRAPGSWVIFGFLFLSHGCMVTALMTDTSPPSRPSNHQPRRPHLLDTLLFISLMPKITGLANATPT